MTIAVIGDVHDLWEREDEQALQALGVDLALFVGDFGNEAVELVQAIAQIPMPKAVVLGNHDAWYTASIWGVKQCPYDRTREDRVQQQLALLGESHVGYGKLDLPDFGLTVVGGRPFTWGGSEWKNQTFYRDRFAVQNFEESADCIAAAAKQASQDTVIFLGHNGPHGLGDRPSDPCGKDWGSPLGGDFGDPDLEQAIDRTRHLGKIIPLVAFGHMHHQLRHTRDYLRTPVHRSPEGTVYLNAARVPRIKTNSEGKKLRQFSLVTLEGQSVSQISLVWLDAAFSIVAEEVLYRLDCPILESA